jgi:rare lipoprotein A
MTADLSVKDGSSMLSKRAANQLGMKQESVAPVKVEAKPADQPTPELKQKVEQAAKH